MSLCTGTSFFVLRLLLGAGCGMALELGVRKESVYEYPLLCFVRVSLYVLLCECVRV